MTSAHIHDSQTMFERIDKYDKGHSLYADSACISADITEMLTCFCIQGRIHKKGVRSELMTVKEQTRNHKLLKKRCRVEHVFGFMKKKVKEVGVRGIE